MNTNVPYPVIATLSIIVIIWIFFWKGVALWTAAKHDQKKWFIVLTVGILPGIFFNAIGILDLTYLFFFAKKKLTLEEMKTWKNFFVKKSPPTHKKHEE